MKSTYFLFTVTLLFAFLCSTISAQHVEITDGPLYIPNGRIGIGTTSPLAKLHISEAENWQFRITNPATFGSHWFLGVSNEDWQSGGKKFLISRSSPSSQAALTINTDNQVGVNEVNPLYQLHVKGKGYFNGFLGVNQTPTEQPLAVKGDIEIGGGADGFDSNSEVVVVRAQSDSWYMGARNATTQANTNFYIGLEGSGDGIFNITNNGKVGIGTAIPAAKLDVTKQSSATVEELLRVGQYGTGDATIRFITGLVPFRQYMMGVDQSDGNKFKISTTTSINSIASGNIATFHPSGGLSLGATTLPTGYDFAVNGKIISEGVNIRLSQNWPDYVFAPGYELKSLEEVEKYIDENNHLPNIPSAKEMKEVGLSVESSSILMMEKIEELTLYLIDQQKQLKRQQSEIEELKTQLIDINQKKSK